MMMILFLAFYVALINGLIVDKVCTWDPVKLLFDWSDFMDLTVRRTELKLLLRL